VLGVCGSGSGEALRRVFFFTTSSSSEAVSSGVTSTTRGFFFGLASATLGAAFALPFAPNGLPLFLGAGSSIGSAPNGSGGISPLNDSTLTSELIGTSSII
jgi:hypothetical protein